MKYGLGPWSDLQCPTCGYDNLHQDRIEVFLDNDLLGEDRRTAHVTITRQFPVTDSDMADNPSPRRDGLLIHFWCEHCEIKPALGGFASKRPNYEAGGWILRQRPMRPERPWMTKT